ncbi:MAG: hypothetical protein AAGH68_15965, partial [Pseudomonadota bacterium]
FQGPDPKGVEQVVQLIREAKVELAEVAPTFEAFAASIEEARTLTSDPLKYEARGPQWARDADQLVQVSNNFFSRIDSLANTFDQKMSNFDAINQQSLRDREIYMKDLERLSNESREILKYTRRLQRALSIRRLRIWVDYLLAPVTLLACLTVYFFVWSATEVTP